MPFCVTLRTDIPHLFTPAGSLSSLVSSHGNSIYIGPVNSIWERANRQLRDLAVYEPGKPIEETARELNADRSEIIKLASNENPLGPSPLAVVAMRTAI